MVAVCFYFQVHQPFRIRRDFDFFQIGTQTKYEDDAANREILRKVATQCYLPANRTMLELIRKHRGRFRIAYSLSGTVLEQFAQYAPDVLESFQELVDTGSVEILGETYYHSLAFLFSVPEFKRQVRRHSETIEELFGVRPRTFRNTELIYDDDLARVVEAMGFEAVVAEGADRVLGWRSPNFVYQPTGAPGLRLLLKNYRLSDDIAFRFSDKGWKDWPLTTEKFACWVHQVAGGGDTVNLFMDYETFGEHQWASTGIFDFLTYLPDAVFRHPDFEFSTPAEVARNHPPVSELSIPEPVSWADAERDLSAWLGNHLQDASAAAVFGMEQDVLATGSPHLIHAWRKLQTSDHFYYMCIKWFADGDVHMYFNPYDSPYEAFILYNNALNHLRHEVAKHEKRRERPMEVPLAYATMSSSSHLGTGTTIFGGSPLP